MRNLKATIVANRHATSTQKTRERINIDIIGPLPKDDGDNEYILVAIDCFSRFLMLYAIPDTTGLVAAKRLLHLLGIFEVPSQIQSD